MKYSVNCWGSKPHTNDDCWYGDDFDNLDDALLTYHGTPTDISVAWIDIDGPDIHEERPNPAYVAEDLKESDAEWQREIEREHLMLHGSLDR